MGELSAFQLSCIVALEMVPENVDANQVKYDLGPFGSIIDVQFWKSQNENRHGFVTFREPEAARLCLDHARDPSSTLSLRVRPVHKYILPRYKIPTPRSPKGRTLSFGAAILSNDQSPSLISRMSHNQPTTPTRQPHLQLKRDPTLVPAKDASGLPLRPVLALSLTRRAESNLVSNGTHEPPHQRKGSIADTLIPEQQPLPARPLQSLYQKPDPPNPEARQVRERDAIMYAVSENNKKHQAEIIRLKNQIQELQTTLRNIKDSRDSALEDVTEKAHRYRQERDKLSLNVEEAGKTANYYKSLSEDLKIDLHRERHMHGDKQRELQRERHDNSKENSELKKQLDAQSRLLSQRASELLHSKQQLHALYLEKNARFSRFSERERAAKSDTKQTRNSSELEEGHVNERQPGPSNPSPQAASHHRVVLAALEKAFIHLEELTNAALPEVPPVEQRDSDSLKIHKRQRLT